jgi:hypothetical protein
MLKAWEGQGIHLWTYEDGTLFLVVGQSEYPFATSNLANTYYETTTDAAEAIGQTVISVTSTANMTATDIIGIVQDDDDIHWSTIASIVADDTVTIDDALTVATASGSEVYHYTASSFKPVSRILNVRRKETTDYEVPINFLSREDYQDLPNKSQNGTVIQTYFSRQEPNGIMYTWNAPSSAVPVLRFTYERKIQIMESSTDTFDLPEYWYEAVIYNLAIRLAPKYGVSQLLLMELKQLAKEALDAALSFDTAVYPITINMRQE